MPLNRAWDENEPIVVMQYSMTPYSSIEPMFSLSRALRVKNETSISENLAHDTGPSLKIGVDGQLFKQVFVSKHISLKVRLFLKRQKSVVFSDFPLNAVKI